jgi:hypothetical protein
MIQLDALWHFSRPALAQALADKLARHQRIAMFGPRQTGKTTLLREEVMPALAARGLLPVYIDCWADRKDPMGSINHALTKRLEEVLLAPGRAGKRAGRTPVKKFGLMGASIELGELPERSLPDSPTLRFDTLLTRLLEAAKTDVVLVFDEFQAIAEAPGADHIAAGLRAALQQAHKRVGVVFSGSSEIELLKLFTTSKAPLFQFAGTEAYALLREDFVGHVAAKFKAATRRDFNQALALRLLESFGHQPAPFLSAIASMVATPAMSLDQARAHVLDARTPSIWTVAWRGLTPLQRGVLRLAAHQARPTAEASLKALSAQLGQATTATSSVNRALQALVDKGLVDRSGSSYTVSDPVMLAWLQSNEALSIRG